MRSTSAGVEVDILPTEGVETGTSILLTGDDGDALASVFGQLVAPAENEHSTLFLTEDNRRTIEREVRSARRGAESRLSVLTCEGPARDDDTTVIDDLSDLTQAGMELSRAVTESQHSADRFRSGLFTSSRLAGETGDTRSVYRFLNTNFLTQIRRGEGIGVCAVDTSADIETDLDSMIAGMERSFNARIHVESDGQGEAELSISGIPADSETVTVDI